MVFMDVNDSFLGMVGKGGCGGGGGGEEEEEEEEEAEERRRGRNGGCEGRREGIVSLAGSQKLSRTDSFDPFRVHDGPTLYNNGGTNKSEGRLMNDDSYDVPAATVGSLQPFPVALEMAFHRFPFTAAQWQELEQQALIFKHMLASVPVPHELLLPIRRSLAAASIVKNTPFSHCNLMGLGGFNVLRSSSSTDAEPGRCRRTDGKKWRCSRDVAPDQRYCERHMHRGRPRSRKPVEVRQQRSNNCVKDAPPPHSTSTLARSPSSLAPPLSSSSPQELPPKTTESSEFRVPSQTAITSSKLTGNSSRYMNWNRGETDGDGMVSGRGESSVVATHRAESLQSKFGGIQLAFLPAAADLHRNDKNDIQGEDGNTVLGAIYSNGLESTTVSQPRRFIDAWSVENRWQHCPAATGSSAAKLSPSHLSLSMSHGAGSSGEEFHQIQMGLGVNDTENLGALTAPSPSWMLPVTWQSSSPVGGPLAEALQSSSGAPAVSPSSPKSSNNRRDPSGGLNLMITDGWGCESSPRMASSPTGVLQKTLAFLSDNGGVGSSQLGAKSEIVLQWLNQQEPPKLPS